MSFTNVFPRLILYFKKHGIKATISRFGLSFSRLFSKNKSVIFYIDLPLFNPSSTILPEHADISRVNRFSSIEKTDIEKIAAITVPETSKKNMMERFDAGACLWLLKLNGMLAAYGWTLLGKTFEPYFFPLGSNDVHLFDFYVFPEFRGKRYNHVLLSHLMAELCLEKRSKAFIDTYEWNASQLHSLARTPFINLGVARKINLFNSLIVLWNKQHSHDYNK
jgi:GNAT superfamily N-acetyltransferase